MGGSSRFLRLVAGVLFVAVCAYVGALLFGNMDRDVQSAYVSAVTVTDSVPLSGIALRREMTISLPKGAELAAEEARRLPAGGVIASGAGEEILSPASALFFSDTDGLERLSADSLDPLSVAGVEELLSAQPEPEEGDVRLVLDGVWYFAALAEESAALPDEGECVLALDGGRRINARIVGKSRPERGKTALLLRLNEADGELMRLRKAEATLILAEYSGLKLPQEAVMTDGDGQTYVYTAAPGAPERRDVTIIYRAGTSCIAQNERSDGALRQGCTVLIPADEREG